MNSLTTKNKPTSMTIKWVTAALMLFVGLSSMPAMAAPQVFKTEAWVVGNFTSTPGESHDAFVVRVATALRAWTDETGTEACGPIVQAKDGTYSVQLTSEKAQTLCIQSISAPAGMKLTGDSIHSHPTANGGGTTVRLTGHDLAALEAAGRIKLVNELRRFNIRTLRMEPNTFSPDDYAGGHGYLVIGDKLLYQNGKGTARTIAVIAPEA